jgi:prephenate dehydratase
MIIGIQGQAGSFHEQVARQWYGETVSLVPYTTFANLFDAHASKQIDAIVTAVENTMYGSINDVYRLIERCSAPIIGEVKLPVVHNLIGLPEASVDEITEIYSQTMALSQCHDTIRTLCPTAEMIEYFDTAAAVEHVQTLNSPHAAAIASTRAAAIHNMAILQPSVQDDPTNITRFVILENRPFSVQANRSSLVITTTHQPGALAKVLQTFASRQINLVKLQSQPIVGQPFTYKFFIDVDSAGTPLQDIVDILRHETHDVTVLGEYVAAA